ncbi:MAG: hypothetical protein H7Y20_09420 [Bryobacteraceae bacterium]|nr:hypothetical protein [Bryobacteraceae bacterium]
MADFTTRILLPNNDDGDLTYYKHRTKQDLLPLVGGTGQVTQSGPRGAGGPGARQGGARPGGPQAARNLPGGMTAMPSAEVGPNGFPAIQFVQPGVPAALGLPNPGIQQVLAAEQSGRPPAAGTDLFQREWLDACKGKSNGVIHGTSSKTHCDFDYAGTMMEQMLLGLVAHQAGKKLEYDPATGQVKNSPEANDYLKRKYRPNWTLNG